MSAQLYNALGKPVKRRRFVITQSDPISPRPYAKYLSKSGFTCYKLENAAKFKSEKDAAEDLEYFRRIYPHFVWTVEPE